MGATEDRMTRAIESREQAKHWLAALIRTTPEESAAESVSDEEALAIAEAELEDGEIGYGITVHATPEGFVAMDPWDLAEQLISELEATVRVVRRERRLLGQALETDPDDIAA